MRANTSRHLILLATTGLGLSLAAGAAFADASAGWGQGRRGPGGVIRQAMASLELSAEQKEKLRTIFQTERQRLAPVREQARANRAAVRIALEAPNPDPTAVGQAALRAHASAQTLREERRAILAKLETVLTPEQRGRLEGFLAAVRAGRARRAGPPA